MTLVSHIVGDTSHSSDTTYTGDTSIISDTSGRSASIVIQILGREGQVLELSQADEMHLETGIFGAIEYSSRYKTYKIGYIHT